jgi:hypothetical protein
MLSSKHSNYPDNVLETLDRMDLYRTSQRDNRIEGHIVEILMIWQQLDAVF